MNKSDLIARIATESNLPKEQVLTFLDTLPSVVSTSLVKNEKINIPGLGIFEAIVRKGRNGYNPISKEPMKIPDTRIVRFKPALKLKKSVKES